MTETRYNFGKRVRRILDRLSVRLEGQTLRTGADAPHLVSIVGVFHKAAGDIERDLGRMERTSHASMVAMLRALRRIVCSHATMVRMRAAVLRNRGA